MAGTIVVDRLESDASYASSINVASPMVISNTITMGSSAAISGNVNIDSGLLFVNALNNRVGVGTDNPNGNLHLSAGQSNEFGHLRVETTTNASITLIRSGVQAWAMYVDNSDSSQLKIGPSNSGVALTTKYFGIDTSGRVTKPYQPAFAAALTRSSSTNYAAATNQTIIFDDASTNDLFNQGGHYSTSTGRFTAPISGIYIFSFSSNMSGGGAWRNVQLRINGTLRRQNYEQADTSWDFLGWTHVVQLSANDYVTCYIANESSTVSIDANALGSGEQWTFFNGYLLG